MRSLSRWRRRSSRHAALHDLMFTPDYHAALPAAVPDHLVCRVVPELVPLIHKHRMEELVVGTK